MAKQKFYRELRLAKMRHCSMMLMDIVMTAKKRELDMIDLTFLKKTEQKLETYYKLMNISSKIPIKKGKETE